MKNSKTELMKHTNIELVFKELQSFDIYNKWNGDFSHETIISDTSTKLIRTKNIYVLRFY